jgi:hypothetical protein
VDENYGWVEMPQHNLNGKFGNKSWVGYALNMTSQRWLTDADFAPNSDCKSLWWHYLFIIVPNEVKWQRNGTLWITGFSNTNSPPAADSEDIVTAAALAMSTGIITGSLFQVTHRSFRCRAFIRQYRYRMSTSFSLLTQKSSRVLRML